VILKLKNGENMPKANENIRNQWKARIANYIQSGLSIVSWCRQNNIAPHTFYYWRDQFAPKTNINRADFAEIREHENTNLFSQKSGITVQYQEFCIILDLQFDATALKHCLEALKELRR
jgi:hypothetical protein